MAFVENPLSLSLPQAAFEKWLGENGYLETLDRCGLDQAIMAGHGSFAALSKAVKTNPFMSLTGTNVDIDATLYCYILFQILCYDAYVNYHWIFLVCWNSITLQLSFMLVNRLGNFDGMLKMQQGKSDLCERREENRQYVTME